MVRHSAAHVEYLTEQEMVCHWAQQSEREKDTLKAAERVLAKGKSWDSHWAHHWEQMLAYNSGGSMDQKSVG